MKKLSLVLAACLLSACATTTPVAGGTDVPAAVSLQNDVQAKVGLQLAGLTGRRVLAAGDTWSAANLTDVKAHLYRNNGVAWVEVGDGNGLTFAAGTYDLSVPLTLSFTNLAHNTSYRIVAIADGDDGATSKDAAGNPVPDVNNASSGPRRADTNFAASPATIASNAGLGNHFDFTTTTSDALDLTVAGNNAAFNLVLRDKVFSGAASGVAISVNAGSVTDPADTAAQISSSLVSTPFDLGDLRVVSFVDTGLDLALGQPFAINATATGGDIPNSYHDGGPGSGFTTPDGYVDPPPSLGWVSNPIGALGFYGALIGRIGPAGTPFPVGSHLPFAPATAAGRLYLTIDNQQPAPNASGTVTGTIFTE